jgi:hypothetical protein
MPTGNRHGSKNGSTKGTGISACLSVYPFWKFMGKDVSLRSEISKKMSEQELNKVLSDAVSLPAETEIVEFKEAKESYDFSKIGKYFSALSNEANLKGKSCAWLIFGVDNNHKTVGSNYRCRRKDLDSLKKEIGDKTTQILHS